VTTTTLRFTRTCRLFLEGAGEFACVVGHGVGAACNEGGPSGFQGRQFLQDRGAGPETFNPESFPRVSHIVMVTRLEQAKNAHGSLPSIAAILRSSKRECFPFPFPWGSIGRETGNGSLS